MRTECLIWDWNGTLLDDVTLCNDCLNQLLEAHGYPQRYDRAGYRELFGFPIEDYYRCAGFDFSRHPSRIWPPNTSGCTIPPALPAPLPPAPREALAAAGPPPAAGDPSRPASRARWNGRCGISAFLAFSTSCSARETLCPRQAGSRPRLAGAAAARPRRRGAGGRQPARRRGGRRPGRAVRALLRRASAPEALRTAGFR